MEISSELFPFLTESDLKELILRTCTRARFRQKVQEMVNAKNNAERQRLISLLASIKAAIASLSQVIAQSSLPTAAFDAARSIAAAAAALPSIPPASLTILPSTADIDAINLAADAHVSPPNYKALAILGAIEAAVAKQANAADDKYSTGRNVAAIASKESEVGAVSASKFGVLTCDSSVPEHSRSQRLKLPKAPLDACKQMIACSSMVPPAPKSSPMKTGNDSNADFAAALTLSLIAAQNKTELSEASKLTPIVEDDVHLNTPPLLTKSFTNVMSYRDERIPTSILSPRRLLAAGTQYMPVFSSRWSKGQLKNETLYEDDETLKEDQ